MLRAAAVLLLGAACAAAPVPPHRPKPPPAVTPGEYALAWAGAEGALTLSRDGGYRLSWRGRDYAGRWHWDARARTLHVDETTDGGATWSPWSARLKADSLEGEGAYASGWEQTPPNTVRVALRAKKP